MNAALKTLLALFVFFLISCSPDSESAPANDLPKIYNMHEHIQSSAQVDGLLEAMDTANVEAILLVGSPGATLLANKQGFTDYDENNIEILNIASTNPGKFVPFCTINPRDQDKLEKLQKCVERGSKGLKLYSGHTLFYDLPLNIPHMDPVYAYMQEENLPILFHINPARDKVRGEMRSVLDSFPNLTVICPHFCLSSINRTRFSKLMDFHPNLWTDISFGFFVEDGLERISDSPEDFRNLIMKYQDRVLFATDLVITANQRKTPEWIHNFTMCYRNMLEKEEYTCQAGFDINRNFTGLALDQDTLEKMYYNNPRRLLGID